MPWNTPGAVAVSIEQCRAWAGWGARLKAAIAPTATAATSNLLIALSSQLLNQVSRKVILRQDPTYGFDSDQARGPLLLCLVPPCKMKMGRGPKLTAITAEAPTTTPVLYRGRGIDPHAIPSTRLPLAQHDEFSKWFAIPIENALPTISVGDGCAVPLLEGLAVSHAS